MPAIHHTKFTRLFSLIFGTIALVVMHPQSLKAQNSGPIDIPLGETPASEVDGDAMWAPIINQPRNPSLPVPTINQGWHHMKIYLSLLMNGAGFGSSLSFEQLLNPWIGLHQDLDYERFNLENNDDWYTTLNGRVGILFNAIPQSLINPYLKLSAGQERWDSPEMKGSDLYGSYQAGMKIKLTEHFNLTLEHDQQYFSQILPPESRGKQRQRDRTQTTNSAYFTVVF